MIRVGIVDAWSYVSQSGQPGTQGSSCSRCRGAFLMWLMHMSRDSCFPETRSIRVVVLRYAIHDIGIPHALQVNISSR